MAPRVAEVLIPSVNWRVMLHGVRKSILKQLFILNIVKASKQKALGALEGNKDYFRREEEVKYLIVSLHCLWGSRTNWRNENTFRA